MVIKSIHYPGNVNVLDISSKGLLIQWILACNYTRLLIKNLHTLDLCVTYSFDLNKWEIESNDSSTYC